MWCGGSPEEEETPLTLEIWVVTHSETMAKHGGIAPMSLIKRNGETWNEGLTLAGEVRDDEG